MGQLMNEIKTVKKYDELINDTQEQLERLQELRIRLIKEQWTIIRIKFHKKYYGDKDYQLTVEYKDLNKKSDDTIEILFEKPSETQYQDLLQRYKNNFLYKEEKCVYTSAIIFHFKESNNSE